MSNDTISDRKTDARVIDRDLADLVFRGLFCLIFVGLGAEHIFSDALIQLLMPEWVPMKRAVSLLCGLWLSIGGMLILFGWKLRIAGIMLAVFLVAVTIAVHLPGVMFNPPTIPADCAWMWMILQRTNLVKNLCLLGVCVHFLHYSPGRFSLERYLAP